MGDWSDGGRVKIERAKEHLSNLETEIRTFLKTGPYLTRTKTDTQAGKRIVRAVVNAEPPIRLGSIIGDTVHNLRSALDCLVYTLVRANGSVPTKENLFPISETETYFKTRDVGKKTAGMSQQAVDIITSLKPYKGGNDWFWMLHRLDIIDNHQILVAVFGKISVTSLDLGAAAPRLPGSNDVFSFRVGIPWKRPADRVQTGTELYSYPIADEAIHMKMNPQFLLEIAFGDIELVKGKPVIPLLHALTNVVEDIVGRFISAKLVS